MSESELKLEFDRSLLSRPFELGTVEITREQIDHYVRAIGETDPRYLSDAAAIAAWGEFRAPPMFLSIYGNFRGNFSLWDHLNLTIDGKTGAGGMDAGQAVEVLGPVRPGDCLTFVGYLKDVYLKTGRSGSMAFTLHEMDITNQEGRLVGRLTKSGARRA